MADQNKLLDSNYDDIQEYDNDLPQWWVWLFILTVIFAPLYVVYFHITPGFDPAQHLAAQLKEIEARKTSAHDSSAAAHLGESELVALSSRSDITTKGREIFVGKCAVCHGQGGEGVVGPNLTDKFWIHGGKAIEIRTVVTNGVVEKGMVPWKGVLSDDDINNVVAYIWTIRNTNVSNGKAPQGNPAE